MRFFVRSIAVIFAMTSIAAPVVAEPGMVGASLYSVESPRSSITYTVVHKLHTVVGTSRKAEGKVVIKPNGTVLVQVRAPVASFDSESSNRDEHMQETMEAARFPFVEFKGMAVIIPPTSFPATQTITLHGQLDFHGRIRPEEVPVTVTFVAPNEVHTAGRLSISLDRYEIDRPSLLFVKINDACQVALDLVLRKQ